MKKDNLSEYRKKSIQALYDQVGKKKIELARVIMEMKAGKVTKPDKKRMIKKEIAQLLTIAREKELIDSAKEEESQSKKGKKL